MNILNLARYGIGALVGASLVWVGFSLYDSNIAYPRIAKEARDGYVLLAEKTSLEAQLAEERRMRTAAELARVGYARLLADTQIRQAEEQARTEQEISSYELALEELGRSCLLDDADIEWLRK